VNATKAAGVDSGPQAELLRYLTSAISAFQKANADLDHALDHHADGDPFAHAKRSRDAVIPAMNSVRTTGDKLETMVADEYWPLPTYREMLFIK
jgi:glutamine synthetase